MVWTRRDSHLARGSGTGLLRFIRGAFGFELISKLLDEAQHRPRTGFTESADGPALNVLRDVDEVIRVLFATVSVRHAMQCFAHPERTFTARRALAAAFVRVKF